MVSGACLLWSDLRSRLWVAVDRQSDVRAVHCVAGLVIFMYSPHVDLSYYLFPCSL